MIAYYFIYACSRQRRKSEGAGVKYHHQMVVPTCDKHIAEQEQP